MRVVRASEGLATYWLSITWWAPLASSACDLHRSIARVGIARVAWIDIHRRPPHSFVGSHAHKQSMTRILGAD